MDQEQQEAIDEQHRRQIEQTSHQAAVSAAAEQQRKQVQNPEFLSQMQEPDVDTDVYDSLEAELGPVLSGSHILGQREESYEEQQSLLNRNVVQRVIAEANPGRLMKENPKMLAQAQGVDATKQNPDPTTRGEFRPPMSSAEKRGIRQAAEVITTRQTLSIGGRGVDAVSSATVENRTVTNESEEASGAASRLSGVFS